MLMLLLKIIVLLIILVPILAFVFARIYKIDRKPDAVYFARTDDGWNIALSRYFPAIKKDRKKRLPLLLCHGLTGNHHCYDFSERLSMARTLAAEGYDVFALDLRGSGFSDKPSWFSTKKYDWDFDDYLNLDIPAAIDKVLEITGAKQLHWVGHSMGGMLAYALLQTDLSKKIKSATILSSPSMLYHLGPALRFKWIIELFSVVPIGTLSKFSAPGAELLPSLQRLVGNFNLERGHVARAHANTVGNVPAKLILEFANWVEQGRILLRDGTDVTAGLEKITTPMMFIAGEKDLTCYPDTVRYAYDRISSEKKEFYPMDPIHGQSMEYGHNSVMFGRGAAKDVYPVIVKWLGKN